MVSRSAPVPLHDSRFPIQPNPLFATHPVLSMPDPCHLQMATPGAPLFCLMAGCTRLYIRTHWACRLTIVCKAAGTTTFKTVAVLSPAALVGSRVDDMVEAADTLMELYHNPRSSPK